VRKGLAGGAIAASLLLAAGCGGHASRPPAPAPGDGLRGLVPEPLPHKPRFTLTDTGGHPFSFAARARGKLTYLYFGYTHCPDACPATLGDLEYALRQQRPSLRPRIQVVFVTVDPRRDTRRALRVWLDHYNRRFIGLTGTERQIEAAEQAAGIPLAPPPRGKGRRYAVSHASFVLPYSPDGRAHVVYTQGFRPGAYAHDMPLLLGYEG
jgi:protein SCO1/2